MLLDQRDDDAVIGGGRLQLSVEADAEALSKRQAPGAVDTRTPGRVNHQLHAAAFVKKPLGNNRLLPRHCSKHALCFGYIIYNLFCGRFRNLDFTGQPVLGFPSI